MTSADGPSFKVKFAFFCTCGSYEQYTGPSQKNADAQNNSLSRYPNSHFINFLPPPLSSLNWGENYFTQMVGLEKKLRTIFTQKNSMSTTF